MGVAFYIQDPCLRDDDFHFGMSVGVFEILRDLLSLVSSSGDSTGKIAADALLLKVAQAFSELHRQGKEWERSEELPPEGQQDQSLQILGTPGIDLDYLYSCLELLKRIALYARANETGVQWS